MARTKPLKPCVQTAQIAGSLKGSIPMIETTRQLIDALLDDRDNIRCLFSDQEMDVLKGEHEHVEGDNRVLFADTNQLYLRCRKCHLWHDPAFFYEIRGKIHMGTSCAFCRVLVSRPGVTKRYFGKKKN